MQTRATHSLRLLSLLLLASSATALRVDIVFSYHGEPVQPMLDVVTMFSSLLGGTLRLNTTVVVKGDVPPPSFEGRLNFTLVMQANVRLQFRANSLVVGSHQSARLDVKVLRTCGGFLTATTPSLATFSSLRLHQMGLGTGLPACVTSARQTRLPCP